MTELDRAKEKLRTELKALGFTDAGITIISKHVAAYTAAAVRLDRSKRPRPPYDPIAKLADVVINGRRA